MHLDRVAAPPAKFRSLSESPPIGAERSPISQNVSNE
ncbi:hypothetical protein POX_f08500 [Penicillium oxalicum]|nr:hypothetical protein POX_f08500 [Penicillium oxalicum]KAI2788113.1 hypothetical protein POX_f08500 [Penicillium oxalicum]